MKSSKSSQAKEKWVRTILGIRACDCGIQGPESLILALTERLARRKVRYVVANLWDGNPPSVALHEELVRRGQESYVLATSWGMSPAIIWKLAALIKEIQPDVLHTHDVKAEFAAVPANAWHRRPLLGSYYGRLMLHSWFLKSADLARFGVFRVFDKLLANSKAQRAELLRWRIAPSRIGIVPSFVDTTVLKPPTPEETLAARRKLGIDPSCRVMATIARLSLNKGHTYMLQAMSEIVRNYPDALYLVPGEGDMHWRGEGGLRGELERQAASLGIARNVRFLGYFPDIQVILQAADLVVSPSLLEGMQVALLEAMAVGLPIVATNIGGTPDAVVDKQTGLLVPPANPSALAEAIQVLLGDRQKMQQMGWAGRKRAEDLFDAQRVADDFLEVCEMVVAGRSRRGVGFTLRSRNAVR